MCAIQDTIWSFSAGKIVAQEVNVQPVPPRLRSKHFASSQRLGATTQNIVLVLMMAGFSNCDYTRVLIAFLIQSHMDID